MINKHVLSIVWAISFLIALCSILILFVGCQKAHVAFWPALAVFCITDKLLNNKS